MHFTEMAERPRCAAAPLIERLVDRHISARPNVTPVDEDRSDSEEDLPGQAFDDADSDDDNILDEESEDSEDESEASERDTQSGQYFIGRDGTERRREPEGRRVGRRERRNVLRERSGITSQCKTDSI